MTRNKVLGYAVGPIGSALIGFITLPLITWFYSAEDIGRISMLQVVASLSVLLFCLGLDQAYTREYHEYSIKPKLFKTAILPGLLLIITAALIIVSIDGQLVSKWLYDIPSSYLSYISILCFILSFLSRFLSLILRMQERSVAYSMSQLLPKVLFLIFILSTIKLGLTKNTYNLITANTLSILAVFMIFAWNTRKEWLTAFKYNINKKDLNNLLSFGLPLVIGGLAAWGLKVMDKFFLRYMSSFSDLGIYSVAISIAGVATIFSGIFNTIWAPMVYKWISEGVNLSQIDKISEYLLSAIYFIIILSGLFSWTLLFFLPTEYADIQYLVSACLIAPLFYTLSEVTSIGIAIERKTSYAMFASVAAMISNAVGNYLLIPHFGSIGAALSTATSFWLYYILRTELSNKIWRKRSFIRTHIITGSLLILVCLNSLIFKNTIFSYFILIIYLIIGFYIFRNSFNDIKSILNHQIIKKRNLT